MSQNSENSNDLETSEVFQKAQFALNQNELEGNDRIIEEDVSTLGGLKKLQEERGSRYKEGQEKQRAQDLQTIKDSTLIFELSENTNIESLKAEDISQFLQTNQEVQNEYLENNLNPDNLVVTTLEKEDGTKYLSVTTQEKSEEANEIINKYKNKDDNFLEEVLSNALGISNTNDLEQIVGQRSELERAELEADQAKQQQAQEDLARVAQEEDLQEFSDTNALFKVGNNIDITSQGISAIKEAFIENNENDLKEKLGENINADNIELIGFQSDGNQYITATRNENEPNTVRSLNQHIDNMPGFLGDMLDNAKEAKGQEEFERLQDLEMFKETNVLYEVGEDVDISPEAIEESKESFIESNSDSLKEKFGDNVSPENISLVGVESNGSKYITATPNQDLENTQNLLDRYKDKGTLDSFLQDVGTTEVSGQSNSKENDLSVDAENFKKTNAIFAIDAETYDSLSKQGSGAPQEFLKNNKDAIQEHLGEDVDLDSLSMLKIRHKGTPYLSVTQTKDLDASTAILDKYQDQGSLSKIFEEITKDARKGKSPAEIEEELRRQRDSQSLDEEQDKTATLDASGIEGSQDLTAKELFFKILKNNPSAKHQVEEQFHQDAREMEARDDLHYFKFEYNDPKTGELLQCVGVTTSAEVLKEIEEHKKNGTLDQFMSKDDVTKIDLGENKGEEETKSLLENKIKDLSSMSESEMKEKITPTPAQELESKNKEHNDQEVGNLSPSGTPNSLAPQEQQR